MTRKSTLHTQYKPGDMFSDSRDENHTWIIVDVQPWKRRGAGRYTYTLINSNTGKTTHMHDVVVNARLKPLLLTQQG